MAICVCKVTPFILYTPMMASGLLKAQSQHALLVATIRRGFIHPDRVKGTGVVVECSCGCCGLSCSEEYTAECESPALFNGVLILLYACWQRRWQTLPDDVVFCRMHVTASEADVVSQKGSQFHSVCSGFCGVDDAVLRLF